jgi:hypothetical protein
MMRALTSRGALQGLLTVAPPFQHIADPNAVAETLERRPTRESARITGASSSALRWDCPLCTVTARPKSATSKTSQSLRAAPSRTRAERLFHDWFLAGDAYDAIASFRSRYVAQLSDAHRSWRGWMCTFGVPRSFVLSSFSRSHVLPFAPATPVKANCERPGHYLCDRGFFCERFRQPSVGP